MSVPTVIPPGGGEVIGDSPERRVEILSDHDTAHVTWSRFGPGRDGADLHVHRRHTDIFYVLGGLLTVRLGLRDQHVTVPAGRFAVVPPLVVHGFRNASESGDLRYLNFHAPGTGFADYMRGLRDGRRLTYDQEDPPADGGRPIGEAAIVDGVDIDAIAIAEASGAHDVEDARVRSYYVLDGAFELDGRPAPPGTWLQVPAGVAHRVDGTRYLTASSGRRA
jgi:mannose-6-phosphate isomerase-like protein (cupin superfamily)